MTDKLVKALEALKILQMSPLINDDTAVRRKEKMLHCISIADGMSNPSIRQASNLSHLLSISIETLLLLCDDSNSDIRMVADESLNRIIRAMSDSNIVKIQVELHKEIKKNGNARSLRAALWRFAELCHLIRPQKGKPYVSTLVPCIIQIAKRTEESVLETLANALPKIFKALGNFTMDNDIKSLLKAFLHNLSSTSPVIRRTAASSIVTICTYCRKPSVFFSYILNTLMDCLVPIRESTSMATVLGVLGCLRLLLPHLVDSEHDSIDEIRGSFGVKSRQPTSEPLVVDRMIQVYEVCFHFTNHNDHNVVNASLETLQQLLQSPPHGLFQVLLNERGILRSRIHASDQPEKLTHRSLSQMSVATSLSHGDENALVELGPVERWAASLPPSVHEAEFVDEDTRSQGSTLDDDVFRHLKIGQDMPESQQVSPTHSREGAISPPEPSLSSTDQIPPACFQHNCDLGSFTDPSVPLEFCARHLVGQFLNPSHSLPAVRVSVQALALGCLAAAVKLYPRLFVLSLDRHFQGTDRISDILSFVNHSDPQLRGLSHVFIGNLIQARLTQSQKQFDKWLSENHSSLTLESLIQMLLKGLEDESSTCCRQALSGVGQCLTRLLESMDSRHALPILDALPRLKSNNYWLVKVKLMEVLSNLDYIAIGYVSSSDAFQRRILDNVLPALLAEEDNRVRHATAQAILKLTELFWFSTTREAWSARGAHLSRRYLGNLLLTPAQGLLEQNQAVATATPTPLDKALPYCSRTVSKSQPALSRLVHRLTQLLLTANNRHLTYGCIETLFLLSQAYPTTVYTQSWHCLLDVKFTKTSNVSPSAGLLSSAIALMTSSPLTLELGCQQWLIQLAGNLFSGMAVSCLQNLETLPPEPSGQKTLWRMLKDPHLCVMAERLLWHIFRVLNVFTHVLDGVQPSTSTSRGTGLPHLSVSVGASALPSPIKRRTSSVSGADLRGVSPAKTDKDDDNKIPRNNFGNIGGIPHYLRLYDLIKSSYSNYKMSLDNSASEKFVGLLSVALGVLAQLLEIATLQEAWRVAEDVLNCLKSTMSIAPIPTVTCVHQLLKCLFGTNLTSQWDETRRTNDYEMNSDIEIPNGGFYLETFQMPYKRFHDYIETGSNKPDREEGTRWMTDLKRKTKASAVFKSNADKSSLASYIRLFEPMVIKSLKQYTVTSNVNLQCKVLQLLSQLVQLKVNYCLLDSDQIFIGFVLKQFEFIEEGQIPQAELLIPRIFQFLMHLSYEKYHSRSIITVPKVLQLCDGLMASGQSPATHCIPALVPVVYDIFLVRGGSGGGGTGGHGHDVAELDIQREVLLSMLLRLVHYPEVLDLLAVALAGARVAGGAPEPCEERWRRWSRQALDAVFAAARQFRLRLGDRSAQRALFRLLAAAAPPRPEDPLLAALFAQPQDGSLSSLERWLGLCVAIWPTILSSCKEESLLARLEEIPVDTPNLDGSLEPALGLDPLNATTSLVSDNLQLSPQHLLARLIFRTIHVVVEQLHNLAFSSGDDESINWHHFHELFSHFLLCCSHLFGSGGSYGKVTSASISLLSEGLVDLKTINKIFLELAIRTPLLTCQWCHVLGLLGYNEHEFWTMVLAPQQNEKDEGKKSLPSLNIELLRIGGTILFCDYMSENVSDVDQLSWLLIEHITSVASLSGEPPVAELVAAVHRNATASGLLVQAIGTKCARTLIKPSAICRVLRCLEGVHPEQSGALLQLLVSSANSLTRGQPAPARRAAAIARRAAEVLLTLPRSSVHAQLTIEEVNALRDALLAEHAQLRDSGFMSVLNKLCALHYSLPPLEQPSGFNPATLRAVTINKSWYLEQVKLRCSEEGSECARLLSQLEFEDIVHVLTHVGFNLANLASCLSLGANLSLEMSQSREDHHPMTERIPEAQLYKAARQATLDHVANLREWIPKPHQVYSPGHQAAKYSRRLDQLFTDASFINKLFELAPAVRCLAITSRRLGQPLPTESLNHLAKFAILCLESCHWLTCEPSFMPHRLSVALGCADTLLREPSLSIIVGQKPSWVGSGAAALTALAQYLLGSELLPGLEPKGLEKALSSAETSAAATASYQLAILVLWLEKTRCRLPETPKFIAEPLRGLVVSLSRTTLANSYVSTPPDAWRQGWTPELTGTWRTSVPALPVHYLQDLETLQQLVFRVQLLGWTSRQQFEEIWMGLLSVLSSYPAAGAAPDELSIMLQASNLAVQAITGLLIQTLYLPVPGNPNTSQLLHQPRENTTPLAPTLCQLKSIHERLAWALQAHGHDAHSHLGHVFTRGNLERVNNPYRYSLGQVSLEYLWTATGVNTFKGTASLLCQKRTHALTTSGLDVHSCIHFLLDLYTQWTSPQSGTPLPLITEAVRSLVSLSDLLTEPAQFQWMLAACLDLARSSLSEHELLSQYLVIAVCKSTAVLKPEPDILERVKKLVESSLRSGFLPSRLAGLHGLLYLIQTGPWDAANEEFQQIVTLAYDYLSKHLDQAGQDEHGLAMWALAYELLSRDSALGSREPAAEPDFIQMALALAPNASTSLHLVMLQGLERLVVARQLPKKYYIQVTKLAVERMRNSNPAHSFAALQLLISCMYTEHFTNPVDSDPETVVQAIERTSAIFDRIKKGYPFEVEAVCSILPQMLTDLFPPSEILTKVIGEFLSPQQPHPKQLAAVVFQVFEQAWRQSQLPLIQDWVVFSLSNFTTCSTLGMAAWWLTCFFISASTNTWLRAVFPRVQTRIGRCDPEDSKLLCIAAADFYHQLTDKSQRQTFVAAFQAAAQQPQTPFSDLIACL